MAFTPIYCPLTATTFAVAWLTSNTSSYRIYKAAIHTCMQYASTPFQAPFSNHYCSATMQSRNYKYEKSNYNSHNVHWPLLLGLARLCSTCVNEELTLWVFPTIKLPPTDSDGELGLAGDDGELHLLSLMLPLQLSRLHTQPTQWIF